MLKQMRFAILALAALLGSGELAADAQFKRVCILSTADSSGNARTAFAIGVKPDAVTAGLAGLSFDGIDRDDQSSGLSAGTTGFAVQTSDGSMNVTVTIRRARTAVTESLGGKSDNFTAPGINWDWFIDASDHLNFRMKDAGAVVRTATGTTALAANTNYTVTGYWDGAVIGVKVGGVQEGTTPVVTALQAPDSTTPLTFARFSWNGGDAGSPYPYQGVIANASMTKGGVLQGQWAMTSVSCP